MRITIKTAAADKQAPDITEPLLSGSIPAATARGRAELAAYAYRQSDVEVPAQALLPGQVYAVGYDAESFSGIVTSVEIRVWLPVTSAAVSLLRK